MHTATLRKWGNSVGVRLPAHMLKILDIQSGDELCISLDEKTHNLIMHPAKQARSGWENAFNCTPKEEANLIPGINNEFDDKEWSW